MTVFRFLFELSRLPWKSAWCGAASITRSVAAWAGGRAEGTAMTPAPPSAPAWLQLLSAPQRQLPPPAPPSRGAPLPQDAPARPVEAFLQPMSIASWQVPSAIAAPMEPPTSRAPPLQLAPTQSTTAPLAAEKQVPPKERRRSGAKDAGGTLRLVSVSLCVSSIAILAQALPGQATARAKSRQRIAPAPRKRRLVSKRWWAKARRRRSRRRRRRSARWT